MFRRKIIASTSPRQVHTPLLLTSILICNSMSAWKHTSQTLQLTITFTPNPPPTHTTSKIKGKRTQLRISSYKPPPLVPHTNTHHRRNCGEAYPRLVAPPAARMPASQQLGTGCLSVGRHHLAGKTRMKAFPTGMCSRCGQSGEQKQDSARPTG